MGTEDAEHFTVRFYYSAEAVRLIKLVPGARYKLVDRMWEVPKDQLAALTAVLQGVDANSMAARRRSETEALRESHRRAALDAVRFLAIPSDIIRIGSRIRLGKFCVIVTGVGPAFRIGMMEVGYLSDSPRGSDVGVWAYYRLATADEAADPSDFRSLIR